VDDAPPLAEDALEDVDEVMGWVAVVDAELDPVEEVVPLEAGPVADAVLLAAVEDAPAAEEVPLLRIAHSALCSAAAAV